MARCEWARTSPEVEYHDTEWGVPVRDEQTMFEHLCLEAAQCGLSWRIVLLRRDAYRQAFHGFDIEKVAEIADDELENIVESSGIVRNRPKARAVVDNARTLLEHRAQIPSLASWMWEFVNNKPVTNRWASMSDVPATSPLSVEVSQVMKRLGFRFVGPTTLYAHMQACGLVNDHLVSCFRRSEVAELA